MRYAWDALRRRRGRTAATAVGIGLATALVVILLAVSEGVRVSSASLAAASGVDLLATSANTSITSGTFPPLTGAHGLPGKVAGADPNVESASPWLIGSLVFANASLYAASNGSAGGTAVPAAWAPTSSGVVGWVPGDNAGLEVPTIHSGPGFSQPGDPHYANGTYAGAATHEVVLDSGLATVLHVEANQTVWASASPVAGPADLAGWFSNATAFRVVGISDPFWLIPSAFLGFFYLSELQSLYGGTWVSHDDASLLLVHLRDPTTATSDQSTIARAVPGLTVFTTGNLLGAVESAVDLYRTFGAVIGVIGIVVATLFTTTVLVMSVDDRSREIAVLRAVGYARRSIGLFVVEEGLLLAVLGFVIGVPAGGLGALALNQFLRGLLPGLPVGFSFISLDATVILESLVEVLGVGLLASLLPAARAVSLPVAEELRAP